MKTFKLFALALVMFGVSVITSTSAFALQCKTGNYGSDECWTTGQHITSDRAAVLAGSVMVYDFVTPTQAGNDEYDAAFNVRLSGATLDQHIVAGVAQKDYASGDRMQLLVRGKGVIRTNTATVVSGDVLRVQAQSGTGNWGEAIRVPPTLETSRDKVLAFALESQSSVATMDAYITVI